MPGALAVFLVSSFSMKNPGKPFPRPGGPIPSNSASGGCKRVFWGMFQKLKKEGGGQRNTIADAQISYTK